MKFQTATRESIKENGFPKPLPASDEVLASMPYELLKFFGTAEPLVEAERYAKTNTESIIAKKNIAKWLSKALDKGLGSMGVIQRQCVLYNVKV